MDTTKNTAEKRSETQFSADANNLEGNANEAFETDKEIKQTTDYSINDQVLDIRNGNHAAEKPYEINDNEDELYDDKPMTIIGNQITVVVVDDIESRFRGKEEGSMDDGNMFWKKWCQSGLKFWCRKYFWEGNYYQYYSKQYERLR